jgi:polyisoprenyl-phosphate glycosyltransferase
MFSLVIPIYNEKLLINELVNRTVKSIELFTKEYEIILVDDGSTDGSLEVLLTCYNENKNIKVVSLSKNFGHQSAFTAGLEYSKGDIIAMMDGDLQDPPELLGTMYQKIVSEGFDIVSGKRTGRHGKSRRNVYAGIFHLVFSSIAGLKNIENTGNFSMMRRMALNALLTMKEKNRYLPGLRSFIGYKHGYVEYIRNDRFRGKSKMSFYKLMVLAADAIFEFSRFPIRFCMILGMIGTIVFLMAGIFVIIAKITGYAVIGWSSTLMSIYFLGSVQLIFMGIVGEYVYRIYKESQNRPIYFVKEFHSR